MDQQQTRECISEFLAIVAERTYIYDRDLAERAILGPVNLSAVGVKEIDAAVLLEIDAWYRMAQDRMQLGAAVAVAAGTAAHRRFCIASDAGEVCSVDVLFAARLVSLVVQLVCGDHGSRNPVEPLTAMLADAWLPHSNGLRPLNGLLERTTAAVEAALRHRPVRRVATTVEDARANVQIDAPVSSGQQASFCDNRASALVVAETSRRHDFLAEVTSDWATPLDPPNDLAGTLETERALFRLGGAVVFGTGGRSGTGEVLQRAETLLVPTLELRREDAESPPLRFRGLLGVRDVRFVSSLDDVVREVDEFFDRRAAQIAERQRRLRLMSRPSAVLERLHDQLRALDDSRFEVSLLSRERALLLTENPLHWRQTAEDTQLIIRGFVESTAVEAPISRRIAESVAAARREQQSMTTLLLAAEIEDWPLSTVRRLQLWHTGRLVGNGNMVRHRQVAMTYDDWVEANRRLGAA